MECPKCGYVLGPFESECPRCARLASQPCDLCGRPGTVGKCEECGKAICSACSVTAEERRLCSVCAPVSLAAARGASAEIQAEPPLPGPGFVREASRPGYDGVWGNVRRALVFMRESLLMAFRDKDLLIPPVLSVVASSAFLAAALLGLWAAGLWEQFFSEAEGWSATKIVAGALIAFAFYAISYFFTGMTVHLINVHLRGQDARLGPAFRDAMKNLGALLLLAFASTVVSLLTSSARRRRAGYGAGDLAAGVIDRVWTVAVYLFLPIIILEDLSLKRAIGRAKEIHTRNLVPIAIGEIGVLLVNRVIGFAAVLIAAVTVVYLGVVVNSALLIPSLVLAGLGLSLVMAYTNFVRTAYYTCLYLWAVERAVGEEAAAVPTPLAAALAA